MILVDLSQTIIAVALKNVTGDFNLGLVRSMILTTLLSYKNKFSAQYGNIVLAVDSIDAKSWRKKKFKFYKAPRRLNQTQAEKEQWEKIFAVSNQFISEAKTILPWKVVAVTMQDEDGTKSAAEADDVIAVLAKHAAKTEKVLIIATDGDFEQLQKYKNVFQWSPIQKKMLVSDAPERNLHEKILRGDPGDGIPNILSIETAFIEKIKQKSITKHILEQWHSNPKSLIDQRDAKYRVEQNRELIDFEHIPEKLATLILETYASADTAPVSKLYQYLVENRMSRLLEHIQDFKVRNSEYVKICPDDDFFG